MSLEQGIVRIFDQSGQPSGMGFVVGPRHIVTCVHVIDSTHTPQAPSSLITIDFPLLKDRPRCQATIVVWQPRPIDIAGLELVEGITLPSGAQPLNLSLREATGKAALRMFGWPSESQEKGEWVGRPNTPFELMGAGADGRWRIDLYGDEYGKVRKGFSGTAVWDNERQAVIGMVVETAKVKSIFYSIPTHLLSEAWPAVIQPAIFESEPYKGLLAYQERDAPLFFGREALTKQLLGRIHSEWVEKQQLVWGNILAIVGASGSGKSSLVRAGLLPTLRSEGWVIRVISPTATPLKSLAIALEEDELEILHLQDKFRQDPRVLDIAMQKRFAPDTRLLLVVDQFEELFTQCKDAAERKAFIDNLLTAVKQETHGHTHVILTLRADFYHKCAAYPDLREVLEQQQAYIGGMSATELREVIKRPLPDRYRLENGLLDEMIEDCCSTLELIETAEKEAKETSQLVPEPGILPLLSHALLETWKRRDTATQTVTLNGYRAAGKAQGAIAETANRLYEQLDEKEKVAMRNIFLRLTELGEGTQDTRRRVSFVELGNDPTTEEVLQKLAQVRLITLDKTGAEVAHEALIRYWKKLQGWLDADREGHLLHRRLTNDTREWIHYDQNPDLLYYGVRLDQWLAWQKSEYAITPNAQEEQFIEASVTAKEARDAEKERLEKEREDARQRELTQQKALAEEQHQRAIEAEKASTDAKTAASKLRQRLYYLGVMVGVAVIFALWGATSSRTATQNADLAATRAVEAENARDEAERKSKLSLAQSLAALALNVAEGVRNQDELGMLLALEAKHINGEQGHDFDWFIDSALRRILNQSYFNIVFDYESSVTSMAFSPDGNWLALGDYNNIILMWSVTDPNAPPILFEIEEHKGDVFNVFSVAFSPDSKWLASGSSDETIRLWSVADPSQAPILLEGHKSWVVSVAFSPDGNWLASGSSDNTIRLWSVAGPSQTPILLEGHKQDVNSVAFSPDGRWLASGSNDDTIRLWSISDPSQAPILLGHENLENHEGDVDHVVFSPDGNWLASGGGYDQTIRLWSVANPGQAPILFEVKGLVTALAFSPDSKWLATGGGMEKAIRLWSVADPDQSPIQLEGQGTVDNIAFSPDGKWLVSGDPGGTIRLWSVADLGQSPTLLEIYYEEAINSVVFSPSSKWLASAGSSTIRLSLVAPPHKTITLDVDRVSSVAFSPDGRWLVLGDTGGAIRLWSVADPGQAPVLFEEYKDWINSVAFSPDGNWLASGGEDNTIRLWSVPDPSQSPILLEGHKGWVFSVAFSPDGNWLASGSNDDTIRVWSVADPSQSPILLEGHGGMVNSVAFSPDGNWLASGGWDSTIRLWSVADLGQAPILLEGHTNSVNSVAFSPDSNWLASGSSDNTIRVWSVAKPRQTPILLEEHGNSVVSVAFSPDGNWLASGSNDNTILLWHTYEYLGIIGCQKVRRNMTWAEWQNYLPNEPYRQTCTNWPVHPSVPEAERPNK